jgi:hypothetical protein
MWSEGLAKMSDRPSKGWIGRWVSVTGLMDVAYQNKRYGLKHLSITVHDEGQIQELDEAQAGFRLASIAKAAPASGSGRPGGAVAAPAAVTKPRTSRPRRTRSQRAGQPQAVAPSPTASQRTGPLPWRLLARIRGWIWVALAILVVAAALGTGADRLPTVIASTALTDLATGAPFATPAEPRGPGHR